jgi:Flp pilus assembly protein TadG
MKSSIGWHKRIAFAAGLMRRALRMHQRGAPHGGRSGEGGNTLVETAITFPILATVILGIFQCGILFSNYIQLTNAVGTGADYLQTIRTSTSDPCKDTFTAISQAASTLAAGNITVTFTFNPSASSVTAKTCSGSQSLLQQGQPATVQATYPASLLIFGKNYLATGATITQTTTVYEY